MFLGQTSRICSNRAFPNSVEEEMSWRRKMMQLINVCFALHLLICIGFGYESFKSGPKRLGWLLNLVNTTVSKVGSPDQAGLECFFIEQNGNLFKSTIVYRFWLYFKLECSPYFYIATRKNREKLVAAFLEKKYRQQLSEVLITEKLDLDKIEHIVGE